MKYKLFVNFDGIMLFNAKHFEQFFTEKNLKKGLDLFLKGEVEPIVTQSSLDMFFIVHGNELSIKMKNDRVQGYLCSCKTETYCSHLSAALFYLQKDTFDVKLKDKTHEKIQRAEIAYKKESQIIIRRRKAELENLENFIVKQKRQVYAWELRPLLTDNSLLSTYDLYCLLLDHLIEGFISPHSIETKELDRLEKTLSLFIERSKTKTPKEAYYLYLALSTTFIHLFNLRYSGDEKKLTDLYAQVCTELSKYCEKGLGAVQEETWHKALMASVETNKNMGSRVYEFLTPPWVSVTKDKQKLWHLSQTLSKRHLKTSYNERLDKLLIIRWMVYLRESKLFKTPLPMIGGEDSVELIIAQADLDFHSGKTAKAFKTLESQYEDVKTNKSTYYQSYLDQLLMTAAKYKRPDLEIKYLRESFVHGLFILPERLQYFLQLLPSVERSKEITGLLNLVKRNPFNYSYDKVVVLLWEDKRWDELIDEIKKHKNKFHLLFDVLNEKLPEYSPASLNLFSKHLIASILEKEFYPYQIELFNKGLEYMDKLPEEERMTFLQTVLNGLLKQSQIYRYIKEEYNLD